MDGVGLAFRVLALGSPKAFVAGFHVAVFHVAELALNGVIWLGAGEVSGIAFIIRIAFELLRRRKQLAGGANACGGESENSPRRPC